MSWLDFANHFLSNQRLHAWSRINRTFLGMVFFLWEIWLWVFWPFPFLFLFSAGRKSHRRTGFWLAIKGRGPLQVVVSFLFLFACDNSNIVWSGDLSVYFFCFLPIFDRELLFFFCFLLIFDQEFLFFFCFLLIFDRKLSLLWKCVSSSIVNDFFSWETPLFLLPRTGMEILILGQGLWWFEVLGQKACRTARHDVCQGVGLGKQFRDKGDVPHLFPWHTYDNDDLEILCKTGHACTHVDTQASSFYGHVTLGLKIHFSYSSQPSDSKICSFINSCIHPSPFWAFGKIFTTFTLQVHTHFSSKTLCSEWQVHFLSKACWLFS